MERKIVTDGATLRQVEDVNAKPAIINNSRTPIVVIEGVEDHLGFMEPSLAEQQQGIEGISVSVVDSRLKVVNPGQSYTSFRQFFRDVYGRDMTREDEKNYDFTQ